MTDAALDGGLIVIPDRDFREAKTIGARWDEARGAWTLPASLANAYALRDADPSITDLRDDLVAPQARFSDARLYPFQRAAAGRLVAAQHGQILVLSPGLGKTAVAVRASDIAVPEDERIVVVAPASLLQTWEREIKKWTTCRCTTYVVRGKLDFDLADKARWIIVSWDKVASDPDVWGKGWPLWILDESVLTKSRGSRRFKALKKIRKGVATFWMLSGSPVTRYVDDLWAQLHLLWPAAFTSFWRFAERYAIVEDTAWGKKVVGTKRGRDAMEENGDLVMVVNQQNVLDLPDYLFAPPVYVALGTKQAKAYQSMADDFIAELDGNDVIAQNEISRLGKLQQIVSWWDHESTKHDALVDLIDTYEGPHLIWTHWRDGAVALTAQLRGKGVQVEHVSGTTPQAQRDKTIEQFKAGYLHALVLSIGVGKFGHTLTSAKTIWYVDKTWNADDYFQSLHRVKRIGLEHRPVVVTLRCPGTVDELVERNLEGKLGGISRLTRSDLKELLMGLGR